MSIREIPLSMHDFFKKLTITGLAAHGQGSRLFGFFLNAAKQTPPPSNFAPTCEVIELGPLTKNHTGFRGLGSLVQKL